MGFPPFHFIFKGTGGWERISEDSVLNRLLFCSFFYLLTVSNALCLHAVSLFREPWLGQLVSIQRQGKEDKILLSAC